MSNEARQSTSSGQQIPGNACPVVVKIGGSVTRPPGNFQTLLELVEKSGRPVVIVPGGGWFADAVRMAQPGHGFDDRTAHLMAILAMHQTAMMMLGVCPWLVACETLDEVRAALSKGGTCIWLPFTECQNDADLPSNWNTTSDAIAARLCERLGNLPLIFVKSRSCEGNGDVWQLVSANLIDPIAAKIIERSDLAYEIVQPLQTTELETLLKSVPAAEPAAAI
ncbi:MAG: uridylate kinase [Alphaproteobacteria bacterium]|nr:uridylate kinase [Alphaproteobacteria bacterium]